MYRAEIIDPANRLPDNIRDIDPNSTQSTIVLRISGHGEFDDKPDKLPPSERDGVVVWSWAAPNMTIVMSTKKDNDNNTRIRALLKDNYPVMDVLNDARQRAVNDLGFAIRQDLDINRRKDPTGVYAAMDSAVETKSTAQIYVPENDILFESDPYDNLYRHYNILDIDEYLREYPEINRDSVPRSSATTFAVPNPHYIPLKVEVVDVRYPSSHNQIALLDGDTYGDYIIIRGEERAYVSLSYIIDNLKERFNFRYIFIVQTSCRYNEFGPDPVVSPAGGPAGVPSIEPRDLTKMMRNTYRRQRSERRKMVVGNDMSRLGGGGRPRVAQMSRNYIMPKKYTKSRSAPQVAMAAMEHVFAMRDGKVLADVKKTVENGILKVRGFVNNKRFNTTKKLKGGRKRGTRRARRTRRRRRHTY